MKLIIFDHPQDVTQEELNNDLLLLPEWRRKKALSYHFLIDQVLCAKAYLLLKQGLKEAYGISGNPEFEYVGHEKPILKDYPGIHFNLSHCKRGVLCVIDNEPIGCDIEEIEKSLDLDVCHYCYSDSEIAEITSSKHPCTEFTKYWTKKEACLKLTGEGINDDLPSLFSETTLSKIAIKTTVCEDKGFIYTIAKYSHQI